jgi:hypothetical protein
VSEDKEVNIVHGAGRRRRDDIQSSDESLRALFYSQTPLELPEEEASKHCSRRSPALNARQRS